MRVWIETLRTSAVCMGVCVTLFVRVWIETASETNEQKNVTSPSS